MKVRAIGRNLLVRVDYDMIDEMMKGQTIALPKEYMDKLRGGCQISTVLSIGESAFDDEPQSVRDIIKVGSRVITARYPGHEIDTDPMKRDADVVKYRLIDSGEIHAIEDEEGADV